MFVWPPDPMQVQMQQQAMALEMAAKQAEIEKTQSETVENMADAQAATAKAQISAFEAGARTAA